MLFDEVFPIADSFTSSPGRILYSGKIRLLLILTVIAHRGVSDECVNFMQKPFSPKELVVKMREILDED